MRWVSAIATIVLSVLLAITPAAQAQTSEESVKATFLYRFSSFLTWPASAFATPDAPIVLCVLGADPFAAILQRVVDGQRLGDRTFDVHRLEDGASAVRCHAVYVTGDRVDETLRAVRDYPVLTITDGAIGGGARGIIHFVQIDDRIRFHIDDARAAEAGLVISSRLLSIAVSVRQRAAP